MEQGHDTAFVLSTRGVAYLEIGELQQGLADIDRALQVEPGFASAYDRRGYAYFLLGDNTRAEDDFGRAVELVATMTEQERAELHYHRALLFQRQGKPGAALAEIDEAVNRVEVPNVRRAIEEVQAELAGAGVVSD